MDKKSSFKYKSWYYFFETLQTIDGIVVQCSDTTTSSPWSLKKYIRRFGNTNIADFKDYKTC